jgi:predicted secreted hydrolase
MRVEPTVRDQEMVIPSQLAASYWEGSSSLSGTFMGKHVSGLGYTELTGYAGH